MLVVLGDLAKMFPEIFFLFRLPLQPNVIFGLELIEYRKGKLQIRVRNRLTNQVSITFCYCCIRYQHNQQINLVALNC